MVANHQESIFSRWCNS